MNTTYILSNAKWILLVNFIQKIINFGLNQILLRITSPEIYGKATIELELFLSSVLFLSREGIRLALLREDISTLEKRQLFINLSWIPSILVLFTSLIMYFIFHGDLIYIIYSIGALFEAMGEPFVNLNLHISNFKPKLMAETLAIVNKSLVTIICLGYLQMNIIGYGIAQVTYGLTYLCVLAYLHGSFKSSESLLLPVLVRSNQNLSFINLSSLHLASVLSIPAFLKHLLTESDKIALSFLASHYDQGIFAVASNYGSLAARMLFLPLEDTARIAFSNLSKQLEAVKLSSSPPSSPSSSASSSIVVVMSENKIHEPISKQSIEILNELKQTMLNLLSVVLFIGSVFVIFGIPYVRLVVDIILGQKWKTEDMIHSLEWYCIYLLTLGLNGITEAFVHSVTSISSLDLIQVNTNLVLSSIVYYGSVYFTMKSFGTSAIIFSSILAMLFRIMGSIYFIHHYFSSRFLNEMDGLFYDILPSWKIIIVILISILGVHISSMSFLASSMTSIDKIKHILVGGIFGIFYVLSTIFLLPSITRQQLIQYLKGNKTLTSTTQPTAAAAAAATTTTTTAMKKKMK